MSQDFGSNPYQSPGGSGGAAASKVAGPAIGLIVVGVLNLLVGIYYVGVGIYGMMFGLPGQQLPPELQADPQAMQFMQQMQNMQGPMAVGIGVVLSIVSALILFGGIKMKGLSSYGLAMTASILAMIPCASPTACCAIGIGIGIWSLVVLLNAEVKSAFH